MPDLSVETVIVRDRDALWRLEDVDEWTVMLLLGSLSADPRSFDELTRAWLRYSPQAPLTDLPWQAADEEPVAGTCLLIDLACLRIVATGGAELPQNKKGYQCDDVDDEGERQLSGVVWINHPPEWECAVADDWQTLRPLPPLCEPLDPRGVLYGRTLADGIAQRALAIAGQEPLPAERVSWNTLDLDGPNRKSQQKMAAQWHALTLRVHADWLLTPRDDLDGNPPRHFLHQGRDWVEMEMQFREFHWSQMRAAPRSLDRDTHAYRYGPFGRHEVVVYFGLCREVIDAAWDWIAKTPDIDQRTLSVMIYKLIQLWLERGTIDDEATPPEAIIECERRRMPLVGDGSHFDCDCPLCRMQAEDVFGPMFRQFDGHHLDLDDEFAFSLYATRDEWEKQQAEDDALEASLIEQRWGTPDAGELSDAAEEDEDPFASVWKHSFVDDEAIRAAGPASPLSIMALAMRLAELVADLKRAGASRALIDLLNQAFDDYRAANESRRSSEPATQALHAALEQIAAAQPQLISKAADLQSKLDERQRDSDSSP